MQLRNGREISQQTDMEAFNLSTYLLQDRLDLAGETRKEGNKKAPKLSGMSQKPGVAWGKNFLLTFAALGE